MTVEIRRTEFTNKGAELMLRAALEQIRQRLPDADVVMIPDSSDSFVLRADMGVKQKAWFQRFGIRWGDLVAMVPVIIRRKYGIYVDSEVDVVLDAAGYAYGDPWPTARLKEAARSSARWKQRGTKLILLPQALGPFSGRTRRRFARQFFSNADLIFPRDAASYRHVTELIGEQPHVQIMPDFTNLLEGYVPSWFDVKSNRFCVIPNQRMIDKNDTHGGELYLDLLTNIVEYLIARDAKPFLLVHEGATDYQLACTINTRLSRPVEIVAQADALSMKGIIGQCDAVLSSRFHGIVSALSQGVLALGTSWSHKYEMLFRDYGLSNGVIDASLPFDEVKSRIDRVSTGAGREELRAMIRYHANRSKNDVRRMWDQVFSAISS